MMAELDDLKLIGLYNRKTIVSEVSSKPKAFI